MKSIKYIMICATAMVFSISSCKKSFLDEKPSEKISPGQIEDALAKDPTLLKGSIAGLYSTMYNTGTGGTTGHDDFGQKGFDIYSDMLSADMVLTSLNYGWYSTVSRYTATVDFTLNPSYIPWRYYYRVVLAANTVIDVLGGNDVVLTDPDKRHAMGQAKAMRAYAYFYLSQLYTTGYGTGAEKTLPVYTDTKAPNQPKSTSAEVYNLIIKDLTAAIDLLKDFSRENKGQINKEVAKGLLSYAYAARGTNQDLEKVVTLTDEVMASGFRLVSQDEVVANLDPTGKLLNPKAGFNDVSNESWIWGADLTIATSLDLISWWGQMDLFTYSYAFVGDIKAINDKLYAAIHADDVRKRQFVAADKYAPTNKFFTPARIKGGQRVVTTDIVYMRSEEMLLLNAEAKAKLGMDIPAKEALKKLLALRIGDYKYLDNLTGDALKEEIYLQTRIELWGEGKSYLSMKRNKHAITLGGNHLDFPGKTFQYNADELTFNIPQQEIVNNPNINK